MTLPLPLVPAGCLVRSEFEMKSEELKVEFHRRETLTPEDLRDDEEGMEPEEDGMEPLEEAELELAEEKTEESVETVEEKEELRDLS